MASGGATSLGDDDAMSREYRIKQEEHTHQLAPNGENARFAQSFVMTSSPSPDDAYFGPSVPEIWPQHLLSALLTLIWTCPRSLVSYHPLTSLHLKHIIYRIGPTSSSITLLTFSVTSHLIRNLDCYLLYPRPLDDHFSSKEGKNKDINKNE